MRMPRLVAGLVTAGLVGFVPVAISAPAHAAALGSTTTLAVAAPFGGAPSFTVGDTLSFSGGTRGSDGSTPFGGTATLQIQTPANPTWTNVSVDTSPSSLFFSGVTAQSNAAYKVVFSGFADSRNSYAASESVPVGVSVAREIKAKTVRLKVIGKVTPDFGKKKLKILRKDGKKYKKFATVKTNKKGRFTFTAPNRNGFRFAVVVPGDAMYAETNNQYRVRRF